MNVNRTLTLMAISGALLAWFAAAATSNRDVPPPIVLPPPHVDLQGADLAKEIARLHDRLRPDAPPRQPARNLFTYHAAVHHDAVPEAAPPKPALSEPAPPTAPPLPPLKLAGIAEDEGPDGPIRTAIISAEGQLFLVKPGDALTSRYRVARVGADAVELTDTIDNSVRRLPLK
ncbi:MAG TPA: hypothetical protein VFB07_11960 [Vicinamibacterales bacterium]|nr:hypothetical protein [Vicinamibacterales bacterium]